MRNKTVLIAIISFALGAFIYNFAPILFQEGNPWPEIKGILKLTFGGLEMVKISDLDNMYLTKSQNGFMAVDAFMKNKGYEFSEQMGSGYFYESSNKNVVITRRQYSRFYAIWTVMENKIKIFNEFELRECLPKIATASHEKCNELLKQITDYDSCVEAGFAMMKSNPPQCATLDGRTFVENKK